MTRQNCKDPLVAFYEEAETACTDYAETGRQLTLADMKRWLKKPDATLPRWRKG